jgi:tripartite-type tricarboxylate transporter receptor subunit TctC
MRSALAIAAALFCLTAQTSAQDYPSKPIRMIVPFSAGGPLDFMARAIGDKLTASLKQNILVENRTGAAGNIGTDLVAKATPDGYTLLMALSSTLTVNPSLYKSMPFDPQRDLRPISILTSNRQMLVVHPSVPVNSVKDFVAAARKEPVSYAHAGHGSPGHLVMEYFRLKADFKANPVPYKGNAPLVNDLVAGHIKAGFVASSGVPDAIVTLLEREANNALKASELRARMRQIDLIPIGTTGAEAKARIKADRELWAGVVKAANLRID